MEDEAILELYFARDEAAIVETNRKYGGYCFSVANAILDCREDAEETVSDTWLQTWDADSSQVDSLVIRYRDGSEYIVSQDYTVNYIFATNELPEDNVAEQVYVSPEEDPNGEGYSYTVNSREYCLHTFMFNRVIDLDEVSEVVINGKAFSVE